MFSILGVFTFISKLISTLKPVDALFPDSIAGEIKKKTNQNVAEGPRCSCLTNQYSAINSVHFQQTKSLSSRLHLKGIHISSWLMGIILTWELNQSLCGVPFFLFPVCISITYGKRALTMCFLKLSFLSVWHSSDQQSLKTITVFQEADRCSLFHVLYRLFLLKQVFVTGAWHH